MSVYTKLMLFVLITGVIFTGFYSIATTLGSENFYDKGITDQYSEKYAALNNNEDINTIKDDLNNIRSDKESQYFTGTWDAIKNSIKMVYNSFENGFTTAQYISEDMRNAGVGLPSYIEGVIYSLIALLLIGMILAIILKVQ